MRGKKIVIEGVAGSGKTTLQNLIRTAHKEQFIYSPSEEEYSVFRNVMPKEQTHTYNQVREKERWYLKYEIEKCKQIEELIAGGNNILIVRDYISPLVFSIAYSLFSKFDTSNEIISDYLSALHERMLIPPDVRIFLDVPSHEVMKRLDLSKKQRDCIWYDGVFVNLIVNSYPYALELTNEQHHRIDGMLAPHAVLKEVEKVLNI